MSINYKYEPIETDDSYGSVSTNKSKKRTSAR